MTLLRLELDQNRQFPRLRQTKAVLRRGATPYMASLAKLAGDWSCRQREKKFDVAETRVQDPTTRTSHSAIGEPGDPRGHVGDRTRPPENLRSRARVGCWMNTSVWFYGVLMHFSRR